jgi:hypothetical protein
MDTFLAQVGLNKNDCYQNAFGAMFCGDEVEKVTGGSNPDARIAKANVRAGVPAAEAYYSDNETYAGMTAERLRQYDSEYAATVVSATDTAYCLEATAGTETFSLTGPGGSVVPGPC